MQKRNVYKLNVCYRLPLWRHATWNVELTQPMTTDRSPAEEGSQPDISRLAA